MEFIYNDYVNWKLENEKIIYELLSNKSNVISRFKHIYDVVESILASVDGNEKVSESEIQIFESGFNYLFDQFQLIQTILDNYYDGDFTKMEDDSEIVNMLLYVNEFQSELSSQDEYDKDDELKLGKFSDEITNMIVNNIKPNKELHDRFDKLAFSIFGENYYGINEIFLDIADEMGIIDFE